MILNNEKIHNVIIINIYNIYEYIIIINPIIIIFFFNLQCTQTSLYKQWLNNNTMSQKNTYDYVNVQCFKTCILV